jgi:hypothetical protein
MDRNTDTGQYDFLPHERDALGLSPEQMSWPINNPSGLLDLAQVRLIEVSTQDLSGIPASADKMKASELQWKQTGYLRAIVTELKPDLPLVMDGVEQFLRQES